VISFELFILAFHEKMPIFGDSIQWTITKSLIFEYIASIVYSSYNNPQQHLLHFHVVVILSFFVREYEIWKRKIKHFLHLF
jgi:hypothetical protein